MVIAYIPQTDVVTPGDVVLTSGLGGVYPEGLVVGKVARVERKDADPFQAAVVEPAVADGQARAHLRPGRHRPMNGALHAFRDRRRRMLAFAALLQSVLGPSCRSSAGGPISSWSWCWPGRCCAARARARSSASWAACCWTRSTYTPFGINTRAVRADRLLARPARGERLPRQPAVLPGHRVAGDARVPHAVLPDPAGARHWPCRR